MIFRGTPHVVGVDRGVWVSVGANGWQRLNMVEGV